VVVPDLAGDFGRRVATQAATLNPPHTLVEIAATGLMGALALSPVPLSTMGRGLDDDPAAFLAAAAAGVHAGELLD
jgi:hypothetical protein